MRGSAGSTASQGYSVEVWGATPPVLFEDSEGATPPRYPTIPYPQTPRSNTTSISHFQAERLACPAWLLPSVPGLPNLPSLPHCSIPGFVGMRDPMHRVQNSKYIYTTESLAVNKTSRETNSHN